MSKGERGRPAGGIFKGKGTAPVRAIVSKEAAARFEKSRARLAKAAGVEHPSDRDVIEYLTLVESGQSLNRIQVLDDVAEGRK